MTGIKQEAESSNNINTIMTDGMVSQQQGLLDPIDSLLDLSEYDNSQYQSPSLSPSALKNTFVRPTAASTPASMLSTGQQMTAPSHQYDQYKQQTGFVPGALANTFAVNQNTVHLAGYSNFAMEYVTIAGNDDIFDFNKAANGSVSPSSVNLDFESPAEQPTCFFHENNAPAHVNIPSTVLSSQDSQGMSTASVDDDMQTSIVGRLWPGMHQQAAIAKAQAQKCQQQEIIRRQNSHTAIQGQTKQDQVPQQTQRHKSSQPADPIVEQKISQLLSSMRSKPTSSQSSSTNGSHLNVSRLRKDEDDMDEDERLLASEEGKKLTSKERRQLRNKVSARAFRSRRKEYISQLESEIATKVSENGDLRAQNRALIDENKRLSDLTRMLLGSPSFSDFLNRLSANPSLVLQPQAAQAAQAVQAVQSSSMNMMGSQVISAPQTQERQAPKDTNSYTAQQQIGMAMIPEQNLDMSMLQMESTPQFSYQPQVYAVIDTPEMPVQPFDASLLSGKSSNFVGSSCDEEKVEMPIIAHPVAVSEIAKTSVSIMPLDKEFENDQDFALYHGISSCGGTESGTAVDTDTVIATQTRMELHNEVKMHLSALTDIVADKGLLCLELVNVTNKETSEAVAVDVFANLRIEYLVRNLEAVSARLSSMVFSQ